MAVDLLVQGREPEGPPPRPGPLVRAERWTAVLLGLTGLAVLAGGVLQTRQEDRTPGVAPAQGQPVEPLERLRPLPRVLLDRATVVEASPAADGVLRLRVRLEGVPRASLLSLRVELPGSAVVLAPLPDRLSAAGTADVDLDVLPRCPQARPGLSQAAVLAVVRGREGARVRDVRVRLDTAGRLTEAVRSRCGAVTGVPDLDASAVQLAGGADDLPAVDAGDLLRTQVVLQPTGRTPVTVAAVHPGPGLAATVRTPLPLNLAPSSPALPLLVDLRPGGCGGAPDTPPYVLVLSTGETLAVSPAPAVQPRLDALRPYTCPG